MSQDKLIKYAIAGFVIYNVINPPRFISVPILKSTGQDITLQNSKSVNRWFVSKFMWASLMKKDSFKFYGVEFKLNKK
jgi:hypothetical protein